MNRETWIADGEMLRNLVFALLYNHPLPWRIEWDWSITVESATGRVFSGSQEQCERLIALAEEIQRGIDDELVRTGGEE